MQNNSMKKALALTCLILLSWCLWGQRRDGATVYQQAAGSQAPLFRARLADVYPANFNGTYLIDTKGFQPGTLCFEGKTYSGLQLNLDASLQHVLLRQESSHLTLDIGLERVHFFTRGNRTFENLCSQGIHVPQGFYEQMAQGPGGRVYKKTEKILRQLLDRSGNACDRIGYQDPFYRDDLMDYYEHKETWYWIKPDGSATRLKTKRKIRKAIQAVHAHETH